MPFKLAELFAEISVKGASQVADSLGSIRREMIKTQRVVNSLGGEMSQGLTFANSLAARELRRGLEPTFRDLQRQTIANLGALKQWSPAQMAAVQGVAAFITKLGTLEFHLTEYQRQLEGVGRLSRWAFFGGSAGILALGGAASPQALRTLTSSFAWLSAEIGTAFVPVIAKAAWGVQTLARYFRDLSPGTKDLIGKWGTVAVVLAGAGVAVNVLVYAFTGLSTALRGVATAYAWVTASARTAAAAQVTSAAAGGGAAAAAAGAAAGITGGSLASRLGGMGLGASGAAAVAGGSLAGRLAAPGLAGAAATPAAASAGALSRFGPALKVAGKWFMIVEAISLGSEILMDQWEQNAKGLSIGGIASGLKKTVGNHSFGLDFLNMMFRPVHWAAGKTQQLMQGADKGLKLSPFGEPWMGRIEDAWKQVQMNITRGLGPEGEQMKVWLDQLAALQQIAANTGNTGVGPQ